MPEVQSTKFCTFQFITYPDVVYKVATAAILIQTRGVQSVLSLEKYVVVIFLKELVIFILFPKAWK